ncbi:MAG TPA: hypothetical protein VD971_05940 [Phycisphaerales bacterium]|nr:hypothetical protein [Phycisphaerales bacterium]
MDELWVLVIHYEDDPACFTQEVAQHMYAAANGPAARAVERLYKDKVLREPCVRMSIVIAGKEVSPHRGFYSEEPTKREPWLGFCVAADGELAALIEPRGLCEDVSRAALTCLGVHLRKKGISSKLVEEELRKLGPFPKNTPFRWLAAHPIELDSSDEDGEEHEIVITLAPRPGVSLKKCAEQIVALRDIVERAPGRPKDCALDTAHSPVGSELCVVCADKKKLLEYVRNALRDHALPSGVNARLRIAHTDAKGRRITLGLKQ